MRFSLLGLALFLAATTTPTFSQGGPNTARLTLVEAMRMAESAHPAVRSRQAQLAAAEGYRNEADALLFNNPELSLQQTRRQNEMTDSSDTAWSFGVAQTIEIGGQQSKRRTAAAAGMASIGAEIDDARRQARADAATRFFAVLAAQHRVQLERRSASLFGDSAGAVAKRRAAGEDTRLDANVAMIEAERARNSLESASEALHAARSELATVVQLPPSALPEVDGNLAAYAKVLPYNLEQLLTSAQTMPKQRALLAREEAARAKLGVEQASRYPDLTVGLQVGREGPNDARERLTTLSISLPVPLFKRNAGGIGQALSDVAQVEIERASLARDTQARVRQLWSRLASQRDRVQRLQLLVVPASADNQQLSQKSLKAGQIGLLDQLIVNRQALDAERDLNDVLAEMHATQIELETAAGWPMEGSTQ
jgi:cobalt-zinc-cadmium efflux system outer membrane protein